MHVAEIRVHPIKSCRPVRREQAAVVAGGLEHDRRYVVVDATGNFVTLRTLPELSTITVEIADTDYSVTLPGDGAFSIPHVSEGPLVRVGIWGRAVAGREEFDAGSALSDWAGVRLRLVGVGGAESLRRLPDDLGEVAFADAWPVLALSRASVADLSERVGAEMEMDRFRPNIVFDGVDEPYAEDRFARVVIGEVPFVGVSLCSRCVATTIDPSTLAMGVEPLATLARYRRFDSSVYLGANLAPTGPGTVHIGDELRVTEVAGSRLPL